MADFSIKYWGVRGSIPVPGPSTVRYGGNTSCLEVLTPAGSIIVDGGTGLRKLGAEFKTPAEIHMIFTHLHWDHIQGFPFFGPIYQKDYTIHIYSGHKADVSLESVLEGQMQEPNFPVDLSKLPAKLTFNEIPLGETFKLSGIQVETIALNHPNGAMGLRFTHEGKSFVHLTDHEHGAEFEQPLLAFCKDADVLSMDTMFTPDEYPKFKGWGHSSWLHACEIARTSGIKQLVLFHHDPRHSDDEMDAIGANARKEFANTVVAKEGLVVTV